MAITSQRRHRRAARQGRPLRDRLSERRARHAGRDRRKPDAADLLEEGIAAGFGRRSAARRAGTGRSSRSESGIGRPWDILAAFDRIDHPARGRDGGRERRGRLCRAEVGAEIRGKGFQLVPPGDRLVVLTPGGGGIGAPEEREAERVARDRRGRAGVGRYRAGCVWLYGREGRRITRRCGICPSRTAAISSRPATQELRNMAKFGIGQAVRRVEDQRFLTGRRAATSTTSCCPACAMA